MLFFRSTVEMVWVFMLSLYYFGFSLSLQALQYVDLDLLFISSYPHIDWFKNLHFALNAKHGVLKLRFKSGTSSISISSSILFDCHSIFFYCQFSYFFFMCAIGICIEYLIRICINSIFFSFRRLVSVLILLPAVQFHFDNGFSFFCVDFLCIVCLFAGEIMIFVTPICTDFCTHECVVHIKHKSRCY